MPPISLLLALFVSSQPMDTGLVVRACMGAKGAAPLLATQVWNASSRSASDLRLRFHLQGSPGSLNDLGWRSLNVGVYMASGILSAAVPSIAEKNVAPTLVRPGCSGDTCSHVVDIPLGSLALAPLEGLTVELNPSHISAVGLDWTPANRLPRRSDWSFSNLDSGSGCPSLNSQTLPRRATRIELYSGSTRVWGNSPGEAWERPDWPLADFSKSSFADLMHTPSDTLPVAERDARNRKLGRWLVNQAGYRKSDVAAGRARVRGVGVAAWTLIDPSGSVRGSGVASSLGGSTSGRLRTSQYEGSNAKVLDSLGPERSGTLTEFVLPSDLPSGGPYRVVSASDTSAPFRVQEDLYGPLRDASLRFFGAQRSGNSSSWFRPASFAGDPVPGGWYDCGDRLKEGFTIGYGMEVLGALAATHPERDPDRTSWLQSLETPDGVPDMVRELRHGAEFALASWDLSGKSPADMVTSVGDLMDDHQSWVHDTWVEFLPTSYGGPGSRTGRKEMGGSIAGSWAAGLAFAARLSSTSDPAFAKRALEAARGLYAWGKANPKVVNPMAYNDDESTSELAFAAVALLWATGDTSFLHDLVRNDSIAKRNRLDWGSAGGWFGKQAGYALSHGSWPMGFGTPQPLALHAFWRLILADPDTAARYGISAADYDSLRGVTMRGTIANLSAVSQGTRLIGLPDEGLKVDSLWGFPTFSVDWGHSRYLAGIFAEMLLYVEMARDLQSRPSFRYPGGTVFHADSVEAAAVRGMDFLLGQNPWDMSFLMGIGSRNLNHLHHRAANPEARNIPAVNWAYRTPVGALAGGAGPHDTLIHDNWMDYTQSETCLDFAASFLVSSTLLARPSGTPPTGLTERRHQRPLPQLAWDARSGVLRWSRASEGFDWDVLDAKGRILFDGRSVGAQGERSFVLPTGVSFLRWRTSDAKGTLPLMQPGR